jgi:N-acetylglutamate synthase/N-acetylornithine aminotransferase
MRATSNISRRTFVSRGASLLAAGASMIMLPGVATATTVAFNGPKGTPGALPELSTLEAFQMAAMEGGPHTNEEMSKCIQLCRDCNTMCTQTIAHCLKLGGRHATADHIRLLADCGQMCATSADYMVRESPFHNQVCRLCSELCKQCAKDCEQVAGDDQMVKQCIEMCRKCAGSCERMASKTAA